MVMRCLLH